MIRAVLAVVLTAALLGASLPAVDDARRDHTDSVVRTELDRFEGAARDLLAADDPVTGDEGARRIVVLHLPEGNWNHVGVDGLRIERWNDGASGRSGWTVERGSRRSRELPDVPLRTPGGEPLVIESGGRHRLVLELVGSPERPVVSVRRFTNQEGASGDHDLAVPDAKRPVSRRMRL